MLPLHLGPLHPFEQGLTLFLAFGPFVVLAIVIVLRKRSDAREEAEEQAAAEGSEGSTDVAPSAGSAGPAGSAGGQGKAQARAER